MQDILLGADYELMVVDDDFMVVNSVIQHIDMILQTHKGTWKQTPTCGFGIINYLKSVTDKQELMRDMLVQLKADGINEASINIDRLLSELKLEIEA